MIDRIHTLIRFIFRFINNTNYANLIIETLRKTHQSYLFNIGSDHPFDWASNLLDGR